MRPVRIVGGRHRGRRLTAPKGTRTRPTTDRVREALFGILFDVEGFAVLDLFAGSGGIGLEALSRGASRAVFAEQDRTAVRCLAENLANLREEEQGEIRAQRALAVVKALIREGGRFDLIYADPPWDRAVELMNEILPKAPLLLTDEGRFVLEHRAVDPAPEPPAGLTLADQRRYGDTALSFYERSNR